MKNRVWILALSAMAVSVSGCSKGFWSSDNKLDENNSIFRSGKEEMKTRDDMTGHKYQKGEKGFFSFGGEGGLLDRTGGKQGKEQVRGNKLFAGALDVVLGLPIMVASREGGLISTDWKVDPEDISLRYRINIRVSGRDPYGEVKVVVLRQRLMGDSWVDQSSDQTTADHIAKSIRKKAQVIRN